MHITRREALTAMAAMPIVVTTGEVTEPTLFTSHELRFRRTADDKDMFDEDGPIAVGTVFESFHEQWESGRPPDLKPIRRIAQKRGRSYRVVGADERATFVFRNYDGDPLTIRLGDVSATRS